MKSQMNNNNSRRYSLRTKSGLKGISPNFSGTSGRSSSCRKLGLILAATTMIIMPLCCTSNASLPFHTVDMVPTAHKVEEERQKKRRKLSLLTNNKEEHHRRRLLRLRRRQNSAVYATLSGPTDDDLTSAEHDFHMYRHLSRYERAYRIKHGLDLQTNWDGRYDVDEDELEEDDTDDLDLVDDEFPAGTHVLRRSSSGSSRNETSSALFTASAPAHRRVQQNTANEQNIVNDGAGSQSKSYQAAPLSQGYGTHYAHIWVGSPTAQRKSVIVDTGSHYTAFPCKGCNNCGEEHHTDPYFDPDKSDTFRSLPCGKCQMGATCHEQQCMVRQDYTEGSSWDAFQVQDVVFVGGRDVLDSADPKHLKYALHFMFGCQMSENGLFVTQLADGIMGMSAHDLTLPKQLYNRHKIPHNVFGLCFRQELDTSKHGVTAGVMTLGGSDTRLDSSPTIYAKNVAPTGWYTVYVQNIFIRAGGGPSATSILKDDQHVIKVPLDLRAINAGKGVIVDSGTTDTYLHKKLAKSFAAVWKQVTKKEYSHKGIILTNDQLKRLPTILVQCRAFDDRPDPSLGGDPQNVIGLAGNLDPTSPYDVLIAIPATNYMEYSPTTNLYSSRLYFTETHGGVLGANAMQGHNVIFDWEQGRVGFAESTCEYTDEHSLMGDQLELDKNAEENQIGGGVHGDDCMLGPPILTQSCLQSLDVEACRLPETNAVLEGQQVWIRRVEHPGTPAGLSCEDAALLESDYTGNGPPTIECNGKGICTEIRPCDLACNELEKEEKLQLEDSTSLCPARWSTCDNECEQTLVRSMKKSDDVCYEMDRVSRPCHKDACGTDDPCRVPYLVHSVLGFKGALKHLWAPRFVETLSRSVVTTVTQKRGANKKPSFSIGDINIVLVTPWRDEDTEEEIGIKVILQISFFNENAKLLIVEKDLNDDNEKKAEEAAAASSSTNDGDDVGEADWKPSIDKVVGTLFGRQQHRRNKYTCTESDLYVLAKNAHEVNTIVEGADFMKVLIGELKIAEGGQNDNNNYAVSPFQDIYNELELLLASKVLSTWTVRTQVEEAGSLMSPSLMAVPGTIRQYAFNTNFMVAFICFLLFVVFWTYERTSKGESVFLKVPGATLHPYTMFLAAFDPNRTVRLRHDKDQDDRLFDQLFVNGDDGGGVREGNSSHNNHDYNRSHRYERSSSARSRNNSRHHTNSTSSTRGSSSSSSASGDRRRRRGGRSTFEIVNSGAATSLSSIDENENGRRQETAMSPSSRSQVGRRVGGDWDLDRELQAGDLELIRRSK